MDGDDERLGHAIVTGDYPLSIRELAGLLAAAAHRPPHSDALGELLARCWTELTLIAPDLAVTIWAAAVEDGANGHHLAAIDLPHYPTSKESI